ncbi:MAG TPA: hypothetical protein DG753_07230 [Clostridium sp.]|nr:hypothetical protein [Clostridium sp.]
MIQEDVKLLYEAYPIIKAIDIKNQNIIGEKSYFRILEVEEYISSVNGACNGILFVLNGNINIKY